MFLLTKPGEADIRNFLSRQQREPLLYEHAGVMSDPPSGYTVDHNRIRLGIGPVVYQKAVEALRRWEMFNLGWLELCWPDAPIVTGTTVAVLAHVLGIWSLNACRIAMVVDEDRDVRRYGFAYATLSEHVERGQEAFTVELHSKDGSVWYDILAHSIPNHVLARVGYPYTRRLQKRFARDSMKAMLRAVNK